MRFDLTIEAELIDTPRTRPTSPGTQAAVLLARHDVIWPSPFGEDQDGWPIILVILCPDDALARTAATWPVGTRILARIDQDPRHEINLAGLLVLHVTARDVTVHHPTPTHQAATGGHRGLPETA